MCSLSECISWFPDDFWPCSRTPRGHHDHISTAISRVQTYPGYCGYSGAGGILSTCAGSGLLGKYSGKKTGHCVNMDTKQFYIVSYFWWDKLKRVTCDFLFFIFCYELNGNGLTSKCTAQKFALSSASLFFCPFAISVSNVLQQEHHFNFITS